MKTWLDLIGFAFRTVLRDFVVYEHGAFIPLGQYYVSFNAPISGAGVGKEKGGGGGVGWGNGRLEQLFPYDLASANLN